MSSDSINVLLVYEDEDFPHLAAEMLASRDDQLTVHAATSAEEGIDAVAEDDFDCIVSDYDMPGESSIEFIKAVRDTNPDLPFILYTGEGSEGVPNDAIAANVTGFMQDDVESDQYTALANRIQDAVTVSRAKSALNETLDRVTDAIYTLDTDWRFTYLNDRADEILDQSKDELLGKSIWEEFPEVAGGEVEEHYRTAMETQESVSFEYYYEPLDLWASISVYPSETGLSIYFRDISDRKEREMARQAERQRFEALIEYSTDIITVIEEDGTIVYQSPSVERVLGYDPDELVDEQAFDYFHPDDREEMVATLAELMEEPEAQTKAVRYRFRHADGSWVWLESIGSNQEAGPFEGYVVNSRDITEQKRLEGQIAGQPES